MTAPLDEGLPGEETGVDKVLVFLRASPGKVSSRTLCDALGELGDASWMSATLHKLHKRGLICRERDTMAKAGVRYLYWAAPTPSIPAESARWSTPEVVKPPVEPDEPEKMLAGNGIALDTEPIKPAEPASESSAEYPAPDPARLQINNRGELTMDGTTFDATTTRELGMFMINTEHLWRPSRVLGAL